MPPLEDLFHENADRISVSHPCASRYELLQAQATALATAFRNEMHIMPIFVGALEEAGWPESQDDRDRYIGRTMREMNLRMTVASEVGTHEPRALEPEVLFTRFKPGPNEEHEALERHMRSKQLHDGLIKLEKKQELFEDAGRPGSPSFTEIHSLSEMGKHERRTVFREWIRYNRSLALNDMMIMHLMSHILHTMFSPSREGSEDN